MHSRTVVKLLCALSISIALLVFLSFEIRKYKYKLHVIMYCGWIAQLEEHKLCTLKVLGSNPARYIFFFNPTVIFGMWSRRSWVQTWVVVFYLVFFYPNCYFVIMGGRVEVIYLFIILLLLSLFFNYFYALMFFFLSFAILSLSSSRSCHNVVTWHKTKVLVGSRKQLNTLDTTMLSWDITKDV